MTYPTFINLAYWTLLVLIVVMLGVIAVLAASIVWMRSRRLARERAVRAAKIERYREGRPPYDPAAWDDAVVVARDLTFGGHGTALVRLVTDLRPVPKLEVV